VNVWLIIGVIKAAAGAWAAFAAAPVAAAPGALSPVFDLVLMAVFVCSGIALVAGARGVGPPRALGTVFVLFGSIFADPIVAVAAANAPAFSTLLRVVYSIHPVALSAAFLWQFAWAFPRPQPGLVAPRAARAIDAVTRYAGVTLFVLVALSGALTPTPPAEWRNAALRDFLWLALVVLSVPPVGLLLAKLHTALPDERRRLRVFVGGIVLGTAPLFLDILAGAFVPAFRGYARDPAHKRLLAQVIAFAILLLPATTAYAVVVNRVLETRFIVRIAIQYALARYTVLTLTAVPALVLGTYLYRERHRPLADIVWSVPPAAWATLLAAVALIAWLRTPILRAIDRRFFREQHDAHEILLSLTDSTRRATSLEQMASLIRTEIDRAFHVQAVTVLVRRDGTFLDPSNALAPLAASAALATLAGGAATPLDVDASQAGSPLARLPDDERAWLDAARSRLVVPLLGVGGALVGLLTLGEKRSEAPYSPDDRALLKIVAAAAATAIEHQLRQSSSGSQPAVAAIEAVHAGDEEPGRECQRCGAVTPATVETCNACGGRTGEAPVPKLLCGKFAVERRIGSGGMGLVYLALDRSLDRHVAVKTLHRLSPTESRRLRREARALATLQHEHLEMIYAVETWRGSPVLVLEYLAGGTLGQRLARGALDAIEVARIGISMADALHSLHRVGVLHCDIKPSNIGFTAQAVPKLLDFGLATALGSRPADAPSTSTQLWPSDFTTHTEALAVRVSLETGAGPAGTLIYMSPEAIDGTAPDVSVDLWGLAVTMYEAIAGAHPFITRGRLETINRIRAANPVALSSVTPRCPEAVSDFLSQALSADARVRPASAREFSARLRSALGASDAVAAV